MKPGLLYKDLKFECIYEWNSLLPKLKSMYKDFYQNDYDCESIIQKYFKGNLNNDPLLQFVMTVVDEMGLELCVHKTVPYYKQLQIYSDVDLNKMIDSTLFIEMDKYGLDKNDIAIIVKTGNRIGVDVDVDTYLKSLMESFEELDLLNGKYLPDSLIFHKNTRNLEYLCSDRTVSLKHILNSLRDIPYIEMIIRKLENLNKKLRI